MRGRNNDVAALVLMPPFVLLLESKMKTCFFTIERPRSVFSRQTRE